MGNRNTHDYKIMRLIRTAATIAAIGATTPAPAMIFYGLDNTANTTNPGTGAPWDAVGKVTGADLSSTSGSCVHIGNGYVITANHVGIDTHVTFDGVTGYAVDGTFTPVQIASGVDAKIFRLTTTPTAAAIPLATATENFAAASPASKAAAAVTLVGWGIGRDTTPVNSGTVNWGGSPTKHWGTNMLTNFSILSAASQPTYSFVTTHLGQGSTTEAGLATYDSGGGLFQQVSGQWCLIGVATLVTNRNGASTSTFGAIDSHNNADGDENLFVRVSSYSAEISAITAIPEPAHYAVTTTAGALALALIRRRQSRSAAMRA